MRILFAGTPEIAVPSLQAIAAEFSVVGVLTAPDSASGRHRRPRPSAVKMAAEELSIPVFQPARLDGRARAEIGARDADLLVVFAYGRIFGPRFLALFPKGGINMHPSALPLFRGPSPIAASILSGAQQSALTVQRIALEMDAGGILRQTPFTLNGDETTASLSPVLGRTAAPELMAVIGEIIAGSVKERPQNHREATFCRMLSHSDGLINWREPAGHIERMIRAYNPWPKARTTFSGENLIILSAQPFPDAEPGSQNDPGLVLGVDNARGILVQTGEGVLAVTEVQPATRKPMDFRSFLNSRVLKSGMKLGDIP